MRTPILYSPAPSPCCNSPFLPRPAFPQNHYPEPLIVWCIHTAHQADTLNLCYPCPLSLYLSPLQVHRLFFGNGAGDMEVVKGQNTLQVAVASLCCALTPGSWGGCCSMCKPRSLSKLTLFPSLVQDREKQKVAKSYLCFLLSWLWVPYSDS